MACDCGSKLRPVESEGAHGFFHRWEQFTTDSGRSSCVNAIIEFEGGICRAVGIKDFTFLDRGVIN